MFIPFNEISEKSRTWVFASENELNQSQTSEIRQILNVFTNNWQSHNQNVHSSFEIIDKRFIIIAADEDKSDVSGCGIDKFMHVILEIEQKLSISLTNKTLLFFKINGEIQLFKLANLKEAITNLKIEENDLYYNTLVTNVKEVKKNFCIPAKDSWLKKYFILQTN